MRVSAAWWELNPPTFWSQAQRCNWATEPRNGDNQRYHADTKNRNFLSRVCVCTVRVQRVSKQHLLFFLEVAFLLLGKLYIRLRQFCFQKLRLEVFVLQNFLNVLQTQHSPCKQLYSYLHSKDPVTWSCARVSAAAMTGVNWHILQSQLCETTQSPQCRQN